MVERLAIDIYFGEASPIKESGFYFDVFKGRENCQRNEPQFYMNYLVQTTCLSQGRFLKLKFTSQRLGYNAQRNAVLLEEFEQFDCRGESRRYLFPIDECSQIPGAPTGFMVRPKRKI